MATKTIMIQGETFEVNQPYEAGHVLTEVEANVLNQTRNENIRNNCAKAVKDALTAKEAGDGEAFSGLTALVAKYDAEYEFSKPGAGGTRIVRDPVEREARSIAKEVLRKFLKDNHKMTLKDFGPERTEENVAKLALREDIIKLAKKNVKAKADVISGAVGSLNVPDESTHPE